VKSPARANSALAILGVATAFAVATPFFSAQSGAARLAGSELTEEALFSTNCPTRFDRYKTAVLFYGTKNKVLVESDSACGGKYGIVYDFNHVKLTLVSRGQTLGVFWGKSGSYWKKNEEILITEIIPSELKTKLTCLKNISMLKLNIKSGELVAPGNRFFLNSNNAIECKSTGKKL